MHQIEIIDKAKTLFIEKITSFSFKQTSNNPQIPVIKIEELICKLLEFIKTSNTQEIIKQQEQGNNSFYEKAQYDCSTIKNIIFEHNLLAKSQVEHLNYIIEIFLADLLSTQPPLAKARKKYQEISENQHLTANAKDLIQDIAQKIFSKSNIFELDYEFDLINHLKYNELAATQEINDFIEPIITTYILSLDQYHLALLLADPSNPLFTLFNKKGTSGHIVVNSSHYAQLKQKTLYCIKEILASKYLAMGEGLLIEICNLDPIFDINTLAHLIQKNFPSEYPSNQDYNKFSEIIRLCNSQKQQDIDTLNDFKAKSLEFKSLILESNMHYLTSENYVACKLNPLKQNTISILIDKGIIEVEHIQAYIGRLDISHEQKKCLLEIIKSHSTCLYNLSLKSKVHIISSLYKYIKYPHSQKQHDRNLCGAISFLSAIADKNPDIILHITRDLIIYGQSNYPIKLKINHYIAENYQDVSLLLSYAIKNSYSHTTEEFNPNHRLAYFQELTAPRQITDWARAIGAEDIQDLVNIQVPSLPMMFSNFFVGKIHDSTFSKVYTPIEEQIKQASILIRNGHSIIFHINPEIITYSIETRYGLLTIKGKNNGYSSFEEFLTNCLNIKHYVFIKSLDFLSGDRLSLCFYSWGCAFNIEISMDQLKENYFGMISFRLTKEVLTKSLQELANMDLEEDNPNLATQKYKI